MGQLKKTVISSDVDYSS